LAEKSCKNDNLDPLKIHTTIQQEAKMAKKKKSLDIMKRRHQKLLYKQLQTGGCQKLKTLDLSPNKNNNKDKSTPYKNVSFACFDDKEN
jgi:hypothetical protein